MSFNNGILYHFELNFKKCQIIVTSLLLQKCNGVFTDSEEEKKLLVAEFLARQGN